MLQVRGARLRAPSPPQAHILRTPPFSPRAAVPLRYTPSLRTPPPQLLPPPRGRALTPGRRALRAPAACRAAGSCPSTTRACLSPAARRPSRGPSCRWANWPPALSQASPGLANCPSGVCMPGPRSARRAAAGSARGAASTSALILAARASPRGCVPGGRARHPVAGAVVAHCRLISRPCPPYTHTHVPGGRGCGACLPTRHQRRRRASCSPAPSRSASTAVSPPRRHRPAPPRGAYAGMRGPHRVR